MASAFSARLAVGSRKLSSVAGINQCIQSFVNFKNNVSAFAAIAAIAPISILAIVGMYGLEVLVAVIQAYVFTILTCVYLKDALHPGH